MRKQTAYFSLALIGVAVVFLARFGLRPAAVGPAGRTGANPSVLAFAATPTVSPTALPATPVASVTPAATATRTAISSPSPVANLTTTPAAAPDVLSQSGASKPAEPTESVERLNTRLRGLTLSAPAVTLAATDPAPDVLAGTGQDVRDAVGASEGTQDTSGPQAPDRIVAPTIKLDSKIVPVGWQEVTSADGGKSLEWVVASYAVSWHKTSARLGEPGNTVLTGHNNELGEVFRHLEHFNLGDPITLYAAGRAYQYKVAEKFILKEEGEPLAQRTENARWIGRFSDERITLMSCWPYTGNSYRIFIIAKPLDRG